MSQREEIGLFLEDLKGEQVTLWGGVFIYTGIVNRVENCFCVLNNASVVYSTGSLNDGKKFSEVEQVGDEWYVNIYHIESCGIMNKKA